jgi:demethylmenaquinone methyltransferase/2-methoxy-6-polyprenyl-1,4-benzoquinol methylase
MAMASGKRGLPIIGLDGDMAMLRAAREKAGDAPLVLADATCLPFRDGSFDSATIAWGIRNIPERNLALREAIRVLRPGGKFVVLDSVLPGNPFVRFLFRVYARFWIPFLAKAMGADPPVYRYFAGSVERFGQKTGFLHEMKAAGFERARALDLSFGLVALFTGNTGEKS